eukprot:10971_1
MQRTINVLLISLSAIVFGLSFFYRASIAPLTDVFENEFNGTSSEIGFMSSLCWVSYFCLQIPCGIIIQFVTPEFVLLISTTLFGIVSLLFGLPFNKNNVTIPSIIMLFSGLSIAPILLAVMSLIAMRMGTNKIPYIGGIVFFSASIFLTAANLLQAYIYEKFEIWRPIYLSVSICVFISLILYSIINYIDNNVYIENEPMELSVSDTKPLLTKSANHLGYRILFGIKIWRDRDDKKLIKSIFKSIKNSMMNPWNYISGLQAFCSLGIIYSFNGLWLISYMTLKFGYNRSLSTFISGTFYVAYAFTNVIFGKLSTKYKRRKIFFIICSFALFAPIFIIYCDKNTHLYVILLMNIIGGIGVGRSPTTFALVREYNNYYKCSDTATGIMSTMATSAAFILQWLIGALIDYNWKMRNGQVNQQNNRIYTTDDYNLGFVSITVLVGIHLFLAISMKETYGKTVVYDENKNYFTRFFC